MKLNSNLIKLYIAEQKTTQKAFADKAGLSRQGFNVILLKRTCSPDSLLKIAKTMGVDPQELLVS